MCEGTFALCEYFNPYKAGNKNILALSIEKLHSW